MLVPGQTWQPALAAAIASSRCVATFVGPAGIGPWQKAETMLAMDRALKDPEYRLIPVLLPGAPTPDRIAIPAFLNLFSWVDFRQGLNDASSMRRLIAGIRAKAPGPPNLLEEESDKPKFVIKLFKPQAFLEMDVLHHSFRVDHQRNPNHPLLLPSEVRMQQLTEEMLGRIATSRFEFRVGLFRQIIESFISGLANAFAKPFDEGCLPPDFLSSEQVIKLRIDENLLHRLKELLDEDLIVEAYIPFFEHVVESAEKAIKEWRNQGTYAPFSSNLLYNLLGLWIEGFISDQEFDQISANPWVADHVSPEDPCALWNFATQLYHRAADLIRVNQEKNHAQSDRSCIEQNKGLEEHSACVQACQLVEFFVNQSRWRNRNFLGLARFWRGKALSLIPGNELQVRSLFESALLDLKASESLGNVHDLLLEFAALVRADNPRKAEQLIQDAVAIRAKLGLV